MDKLNGTLDFNDRIIETISIAKSGGTSDLGNTSVASPFTINVKQASYCQVENNPLKEYINEEGRNLSPS